MTAFRLFGALEVEHGGTALPLGGAKERALLAFLLLNANEVISRGALVDALWGDRPPPTAAHALDVHVSQVRQALEPVDGRTLLDTRPGGYILRVDPEAIDVFRFERLVDEGLRALEDGEPAGAEERLAAALELCRGEPLADVALEPFAPPEIRRIEELQLAATEGRLEATLALGRHVEAVPELEALVAQHPLRERLHGRLMRALYGSGRQAEALEAYQEARRLLVGELGLEPSRELQELEQAILRHDPALNGAGSAAATPTETPPTRYARNGEVSIAYQVTGDGPFDVVYVPPFVTNVELMWEIPSWAAFARQLSSFCRLIRFDKRGTGMSDRVETGGLATRADDIRAVMDAAPSTRAALLGASDGAPLAILYAARHPERVWALVLSGAIVEARHDDGPPAAWSADEPSGDVDEEVRIWTEPGHAESVAASLGAPDARELATMWRQSASPGTMRSFDDTVDELDVRGVLPEIRVPTLVLNRAGDDPAVIAGSRSVAERIPGAVHRVLPGTNHVMFGGNWRQVATEIERFLREAHAGGAATG